MKFNRVKWGMETIDVKKSDAKGFESLNIYNTFAISPRFLYIFRSRIDIFCSDFPASFHDPRLKLRETFHSSTSIRESCGLISRRAQKIDDKSGNLFARPRSWKIYAVRGEDILFGKSFSESRPSAIAMYDAQTARRHTHLALCIPS